MYIDYIVLGVICVAVLIWAYSRLPDDDANEGNGGHPEPVHPTDPTSPSSGRGPSSEDDDRDGTPAGDGYPEREPEIERPTVPSG
jgi:hypothetical protein